MKGVVMGFTEVLTIIFVVLKILGRIDWSWWLVLLPKIIAVVLYIIICVSVAIKTHRINKQIDKIIEDMH